MNTIRLNTMNGSSSDVYVCDSMAGLKPLLSDEKDVIVIIDRHLDNLYPHLFDDQHLFCREKIIVDVSESAKTLSTVETIIDRLLQMEADRNTFLLGVGGGVMTDIVGFVASIYKRGVKYGSLPTSLLAQVDASVGGKTGVNQNGYKNIIGTFYQPVFTYINIDFLKTLPKREFLSGAAELIKTFVIADKSAYEEAVDLLKSHQTAEQILQQNGPRETLKKLIHTAITIKTRIVERDERESAERRVLNFGHTFGHAIEKCSSHDKTKNGRSRDIAENADYILHGEAVSIGMVIAANISHRLGFLDSKSKERIISDLSEIGLPTATSIPAEDLVNAILNDKKIEGKDINFVLLNNIGSCFVNKISVNDLKDYFHDLCQYR